MTEQSQEVSLALEKCD